jgi:hypothetical protein
MKKFGIVLVLASMALTSIAQADLGNCARFEDDSIGCISLLTALASSGPVGTSIGLTSAFSNYDGKAAYVAQLRDDSAQYVAADGSAPATALLQDAIQTIRAQDANTQSMSDREVAIQLLSM